MSSLTPLHFAAAKGYTEVALALVAKEATIEACDDRKWVPLHWAAYR
jgi:ankyrin repeat protein